MPSRRAMHALWILVLAIALGLPTTSANPSIVINELAYHVLQSQSGTIQSECDGAVDIYNAHASELINPTYYTAYPQRFYYYQSDLNGPLMVPPVHISNAAGNSSSTRFFAYQCRASAAVPATQYPYLFSLILTPNKAVYRVGEQVRADIAIKSNAGAMKNVRILKTYAGTRIVNASSTDGALTYDANGFDWNIGTLSTGESQSLQILFSLTTAGTFQPLNGFRFSYDGPSYVNTDANYHANSNLRIRVIKNTSCVTGAAECSLDINSNIVQAEIINQSDIVHDIREFRIIRTGIAANSNPNSGIDITGNIPGGVEFPIPLYPYNDDDNAIQFTLEDRVSSPPSYWFKYKAYARLDHNMHVQVNDFTYDQGILVVAPDIVIGPPGGSGSSGGGGAGESPIGGTTSSTIEVYQTGPIIERIDQSKLIVEKYVAPATIEQGQSAQVTLSISNAGDRMARDVELVDFFPRNFVITTTNYSRISDVLGGFELGWKIDEIQPSQEVIVRYTLTAGPLVEPGNYDLRQPSARVLGQEKARGPALTIGVSGKGRPILNQNYFIDVTKELRDANPSEYLVNIVALNTGTDESPEFVLRDYCGSSVRSIKPAPDRLPCSWKMRLAAGERFEISYIMTKLNNEIEYPNILGIEFEKQQIRLIPFTRLELKTREEKFWDLVRDILLLTASLIALLLLLWAIKRRWEGKPIIDLSLEKWEFVRNMFKV